MKHLAYGSLLLCALTSNAAATSILNDVYHIGNSLTFDFLYEYSLDKYSLDDLAADVGFENTQTGSHIRCSKGPAYIYQNPSETCEPPTPSTWETALPSQAWDGIAIQLHHFPNLETLGLQVDAIINMVGAATSSQNPDLLLFMPQPRLMWDVAQRWAEQTLDEDSQPFEYSEKYFRDLITRVKTQLPQTKVWGIPGPQFQLELLATGLIENRAEIYRDHHHASDAGKWIKRVAHMEIRFGPQDWPPYNETLDVDWQLAATELVRQQMQAFNGSLFPGDYNTDGFVDAADYTKWRDQLGQSVILPNENPASATPGTVDPEDYTFWSTRFEGHSVNSSPATVPEPASWLLVLCAMLAVYRNHRP